MVQKKNDIRCNVQIRRFILAILLVATFAMVGVLLAPAASVLAAPSAQADQPVAIYFFWGDGCPHCAAAKPVLEELTRKYPSAEVRAYEVWYVEQN